MIFVSKQNSLGWVYSHKNEARLICVNYDDYLIETGGVKIDQKKLQKERIMLAKKS